MRVARFSLTKTRQLDKLILDYLSGHPALSKFVSVFPSAENFEEIIARRAFSAEKRALLKDILTSQYEQHLTSAVKQNIDALTDANTYTVTTGHQLCLFSGPMYFVFKILSTIKLAKKLSDQFPQHHFVPVFWLASEDHDVAEINHTHLFGKRINWNTTQAGAVGAMNLQGIAEALASFENILGNGKAATDVEILKEAYSLHTLSDATRHLVNALFVKYGLVILDGNDRTLKQSFSGVMKDELLHGKSAESIGSTSDELKKLGYKTQVNAREINLFYLSEGNRQRIVKANGKWNVVDGAKQWTEDSLLAELEAAPERFSPNVLMRPAYQEFVLPNIAYVGGPGEIAYWLQLKQNFDRLGVPYPMLVLRDSAMLISTRTQEKLKKLGLEATDIFNEKHLLQKQMLAGEDLSLATYKAKLSSIYSELKQHVSNTDKMLAAAADAEEAKALAGIDNIEKKMLKAAKAREEQKLNQLDKLTEELLPGGVMSERRDNYFQYRSEFGEGLTDVLLEAFDPLGAELKLVYQDLSLSK